MRTDDFNLIDEPWIKVRTADARLKELSLQDVFQQAHEIRAIAGELPTQDAAILRLLLAVLHTVFSRFDLDGEPSPLEEEDDALDRWQELWEGGQFPMEPLQTYLNSVKDRFWLFDEEYPFYQAPGAKEIAGRNTKGELKCKAVKMNGEINQSDNKKRIFMGRDRRERESLSYAEAARWLIHLISYDDCAVKKSDSYKKQEKAGRIKEDGSPGTGWLGKLGLVYAEGDNLFETLMLNLVLCPNGVWDEDHGKENPVWEWDDNTVRERKKVVCPDNMSELMTFPSRYILLEREAGRVVGAYPVYGMYFNSDTPMEQMTLRWGALKKKVTSPYAPKLHDTGVFLWQEFEPLFVAAEENGDSRPGVVRWINMLQAPEYHMIDQKKMVRFSSVGISYDSNKSSIEEIASDSLSFHAGLLSELGVRWRKMISDEVSFTESVSDRVGWLAKDLCIAESGSTEKDKRVKAAGEQGKVCFYEQMDIPFRKWLCSISADASNEEEKRTEWRTKVLYEARCLGREMVERAGSAAYAGRIIQEKENAPKKRYSAPKAYADFLRRLGYLKKA